VSEFDYLDDAEPFAFDPDFRSELDEYFEARAAPLQDAFERAETARALDRGEAEASALIAAEGARAGVELDVAEASAAVNVAFAEAAEIMVAEGMAPDEVAARLFTPEAARQAVRFYADDVAREQRSKGGDEIALVARYFDAPSQRGERPPASAEQQAIIDRALRRG
jgi:hypothetical protein